MRLEAENLTFSYGKRKVLDGISLTLGEGTLMSLLGRNGSGKTTLMRIILGFLHPDSGRIMIDGMETRAMTEREKASRIAYIPQSSSMVYSYTVMDSVLMGRAPALSIFSRPGKADREKAEEALNMLGIYKLKDRSANAISGGERQLMMIARALTQDAGILLLDEPTASLDYSNQLLVMETLGKLRKRGYAILFSTHSPEQALMNSSEVMVLAGSRTVFSGVPENLMDGKVLEELYSRKLFIGSIDTGENRRIVCIPR